MSKETKWQRVNRETLVEEKFLTVYHDKVKVQNGSIRDYYLTKKSDIVVVVAVTPGDEIVMLEEYKYAANKRLTVLPAGHIDNGESPEEAGKRELLEETGFQAESYEYLGTLFEAPVQDLHKVEVVLAKNAVQFQEPQLEETEDLTSWLIEIEDIKQNVLQEIFNPAAL